MRVNIVMNKKEGMPRLETLFNSFSLSNALMNAGYDYIWTNRDLFHSDYARKAFRIFRPLSSESQGFLQYHESLRQERISSLMVALLIWMPSINTSKGKGSALIKAK